MINVKWHTQRLPVLLTVVNLLIFVILYCTINTCNEYECRLSDTFVYRQEDAQEFLSFIMDQMHDELLKFEGQSVGVNGAKSALVSSTEDDEWETVGAKNKSAVTRTQSFIPSELSDIFGGQFKSVVKARGIFVIIF